MAAATFSIDPTGPLSADQRHLVADAHDRGRKIRRAAGVAGFNGWSIGLIAALSAPFALFSLTGILLTAGMGLVAYHEFQGRRRLLALDPTAPAFLGWNQLGFLALITAYGLWMIVTSVAGESPLVAEFNAKPELRQVFDSVEGIDQMYRQFVVGFYGLVIAMSAVFQGGNAYYYFSLRQRMTDYLQSTPGWVCDLQRSTSAS